jgi:hypothetical protein
MLTVRVMFFKVYICSIRDKYVFFFLNLLEFPIIFVKYYFISQNFQFYFAKFREIRLRNFGEISRNKIKISPKYASNFLCEISRNFVSRNFVSILLCYLPVK